MTHRRTLERHVRESNAIEHVWAQPGELLYDRHLQAAQLVLARAKKGALTSPVEIHSMLLPELGGYRLREVGIGSRVMPPHTDVPARMCEWHSAYERWHSVLDKKSAPHWRQWVEDRAWVLHMWLLCIHPFADGNGRTSRLVLNSFIRSAGFRWFIVPEKHKQGYYACIREFEEKVFYNWHPPAQWKY
ncbi:MAG: Fic family protein [Parcubacteria group bacterium]|nr:Fic family protein [Parcubacteria group bacterium]